MGDADRMVGEAERSALSLLRRGEVLGALARTEALPRDQRSLRLAVLAAEARVCSGRGDLDELEGLRDQVAAADDPLLALRVQAALAEHHAARGSQVGGVIAVQLLDEVAGRPMVTTDELWARGRFWRVHAAARLFFDLADRPASALASLERAKADFREAGFDAESTRSTADIHFLWTIAFVEDIERTYDTIEECLTRLRQHDSSYVDLVLAYRVFLDMARGDFAATHAGATEIDRIGTTRPLHPVARLIVSGIRVAIPLIAEGPTAAVLRAIDQHLALVRSESLPATAGQYVTLASLLVDAGNVSAEHLALARRWATQAAAGEPSTPRTTQDLAALVTRLDLLERGDEAAVQAVDADLEQARRLGFRRDAAQRALRAALAARRIGRHDLAERLYLDGVKDLPAPDHRIFWENALVAAVLATRPAAPAGALVRVLGPDVTVDVDGRRRPLSAGLARLVVVLVADGGAAPVDRVADVLWPDAAPDTARARLRVASHRLRQALRTDDDEPLPRRGDMLALAPSISVDATRFEKLATGTTDDRRAALDLYQGDVAQVQLAYDDIAAPLRRRLAALWRIIAREALDDPRLPTATLMRIATVAGYGAATDPEVAELLSSAERRLRTP